MPYKQKIIEKEYFSIGEVAEMFGVATSLIRFWEKEFSIIKPQKNNKGNRVFNKKDIENFRLIHYLVKEKGYTLQGANDIIKNNKAISMDKIEVIDSLKDIRSFLIELKDMM
jgi:DNA-binding transcriptional MerR regulator